MIPNGMRMNKIKEDEISILLDTYMYLNYQEAQEKQTLQSLMADMGKLSEYQEDGKYYQEYRILEQAMERNSALGEMTISNVSNQMGYDSGTAACTFTDSKQDSVYIMYRGTGDGEWLDNGMGMTQASTTQQMRALDYFESVVKNNELTQADRVIVTGHSKGGNKAQFVTMESEQAELIDCCYSVDGQGFSENAIEKWKQTYGEQGYSARIQKLYGIHGENDYVSVLGHCIIPKEHILYIETPAEKTNFAGFHDIKYFFADLQKGNELGESGGSKGWTRFSGQQNAYVARRGALGDYAALLSGAIMKLPVEERDGCAAFMMQLMELGGAKKEGQNGEKLTIWDAIDFLRYGLPTIAASLFFMEEGKTLLEKLGRHAGHQTAYSVCIQALEAQGEQFLQHSNQLLTYAEQVKQVAGELNLFMSVGILYGNQMNWEVDKIDKEAKKLKEMADVLGETSHLYALCEQQVQEYGFLSYKG